MTIHTTHPFAGGEPDPVRRLRARLGGRVAAWATGEGPARAGLTVTSMLVAHGDPAHVVGLLDPDSDLAVALDPGTRVCVALLSWTHRDLAEQLAGLMPAPGGVFAGSGWEQGAAGPRPAGTTAWAEATVVDLRAVGWSLEVLARLDEVVVGDDDDPLFHRRGRYVRGGAEPERG